MTTTATAADYRWLDEMCPELAVGYSLTLLRDRQPADVLWRLAGTNLRELGGYKQVVQAVGDQAYPSLVAATAVSEWTLVLELNSYFCTDPKQLKRLSKGTTLVTHTVEGSSDNFIWAEDGRVVVRFPTASPYYREGVEPDALTDTMRRVGFSLNGGTDDEEGGYDPDLMYRTFALAQEVTGVRLTPALLIDSSFTAADVGSGGRAAMTS